LRREEGVVCLRTASAATGSLGKGKEGFGGTCEGVSDGEKAVGVRVGEA
jgi:hypothetical protein